MAAATTSVTGGEGETPLLEAPMMTEEEVGAISLSYAATDFDDRLKEIMETMGVVRVTDVLTTDECEVLHTNFGKDLLEVLPADMIGEAWTDAQTQTLPDLWNPDLPLGLPGRGVLHAYNLPYGHFARAVRKHAAIKGLFATLFNESDLVVSLDNPFFGSRRMPGEPTSNVQWLHVDANATDPVMYQGIVYVWDCDRPPDSMTVVMSESHADGHFQSIVQDAAFKNKPTLHYCEINKMQDSETRQRVLKAALSRARRVPMPAGSVLLWDSRLIHQGWRGGARLAQPVAWAPRAERSMLALNSKIAATLLGVATTHSPTQGAWHPFWNKTWDTSATAKLQSLKLQRHTLQPLPASAVPATAVSEALRKDFPVGLSDGCDSFMESFLTTIGRAYIEPSVFEDL